MNNAIEIFKASNFYSEFFDSFSCCEKLEVDLDNTAVSEAIYFHICKMKYAGWRHRINFKRKRKHSFSELFQDIIAFYLKTTLSNSYAIELETKIGRVQPDITIKRDNRYIFVIEVKTTIGWERPDWKSNEPFKKISDRITDLSTIFAVPSENVIYVFEECSNVNEEFSDMFWDKDKREPKPRPIEFPLSQIYPLFNASDPYYWEHPGINKDEKCAKISDEEIQSRAKWNIVTPFEEILIKITTAKISE